MYDRDHNKTIKTPSKHMQDIDHERSLVANDPVTVQLRNNAVLLKHVQINHFTYSQFVVGKRIQTSLEVNKCPTLVEAGFTLRGCYLISFAGFTAPI